MPKKKITKSKPTKKVVMAKKMPSKKVKTTARKPVTKRKVVVQEQESNPWIWAQSYTSLLLGIVVVIIAVLFVATLVKVRHTQQTSSISTVATPTPTAEPTQPQTYTVKTGDDLWHISEKFYKSGYNYVDIAKANNLSNPGSINAGDKLIIPSITPNATQTIDSSDTNTELTALPIPTVVQPDAIKTNTYTVERGDDLWDIAVRAYADGYKWTEIAKANNLDNPGLIFSGNVLTIPR